MQVERFFHIRPNLNNGGATVRVCGDTERVGQVDVQVAYCHTKQGGKGDPYCKDFGRETAKQKPAKVIPLRCLPKELERVAQEAYKRAYGHTVSEVYARGWYDFSIKYFLPKE